MEVPHTQRFDVLVPKIVIYTSCYLLNCANILRRKRYSAPPPFIIILVNRGIWCYDSIYTAELIIYHSANAISAITIKIIITSSIMINF